jgi:hypothetical protein
MNIRNLALISTALCAGVGGSYIAMRAGPLYDQVNVDLPYAVTVGGKVLQPGHYEIKQLSTAGSPVVQIFTNDGMKLETSVMTIPALDNKTPDQTAVVLHHFGDDYYFDKIWIQGKNYGYEFVLPESVKAREREGGTPVNIPAAYNSAPEENKPPANQEGAVPAPPETSAPAAETPAPSPAPETAPTPPPQEPPTSDAAPNPTPSSAPSPDSNTSETGRNRKMPDTAANWLIWMLSGSGLSGAGIMLSRRPR